MPNPREPVLIQVDHREVGSGVVEALRALDGMNVEVLQLELADYILAPQVVVERKSAADLAASIVDRRLFAQVRQLTPVFERVIYLIEGASLYQGSRLHPNAIRGALSYLVVLAGVSIMRTESPEDTASLLATMARHAQQGLGYEISLHPKRRGESPARQMRTFAEGLPGIGPQMAARLLERFETLEKLLNAPEPELAQVHGIGQKTAARIRELLARVYAPETDS